MVCKEIESRILAGIEQARLSSKFRLSSLDSGPTRTGSHIFKAESRSGGRERIIKISAQDRIDNSLKVYPVVSEFFPTPESRRETRSALSYEFVEGVTLDRITRENSPVALQVVGELYQSTLNLWKNSVTPYNPQETIYDHKAETVRNLTRLLSQLRRHSPLPLDCPIEISGIRYQSLENLIQELADNFSEPKISVLDPGDANSQNIIVSPNQTWSLIDIEKTGRYDPAYILARQLGQWALYVKDPKQVSWDFIREPFGVSVDYNPHRLPIASSLAEVAESTLGEFIKTQGDLNWRKRLEAYLFTFFARYVILSESWILKRYGSLASGPLLAEAIIRSSSPRSDNERSNSDESQKPPYKLAIVIVNYNTGDLLGKCLDSIEKSLVTNELNFEIVVVDNGSRDNSMERAKLEERNISVRVIKNQRNLGFAKATNKGIERTNAEYFLLLNPDTEVLEHSVKSMIDFMESNSDVGILGPLVKKPDGSVDWRCRRNLTGLSLFSGKKAKKLNEQELLLPGPVDTVSGACMLVRKSVVDQVGLLDESYFLGIEDVDWCFRVANTINPDSSQNWQVFFFPDAAILHLGGQSRRNDKLRSSVELVKSMIIFADKNICPTRPKWQRPLIRTGAFLYGVKKGIDSLRYWR